MDSTPSNGRPPAGDEDTPSPDGSQQSAGDTAASGASDATSPPPNTDAPGSSDAPRAEDDSDQDESEQDAAAAGVAESGVAESGDAVDEEPEDLKANAADDAEADSGGDPEADAGDDDAETVEEAADQEREAETEEDDASVDATIPGETLDEDVLADIEIEPRLLKAAESMIFAADEPVPPHRIAEIFADVTGRMQPDIATVEAHVRALNQEYQSTGRTLVVHEWSGGYRMTTRPEMSPFVKALVVGEQETSLSRSLLETLAVLAYRQPVTRPEVDFVRGVNSDYAIRKLLDLGLADVKGRSESLGRPLLYGTTDRFLEQFGLNTLDDLPTLREIEDLLDDPNFDEERSQLLQLDTEKEITDRETAKEVLSEAREKVQKGELDAEAFMEAGEDEAAPSADNPDAGESADVEEESNAPEENSPAPEE